MNSDITRSLIVSLRLVIVCWIIFLISYFIFPPLNAFGIIPRSFSHLSGIIFAPLLHASGSHIISNTVPLFFLTTVIIYVYPIIAMRVIAFSWLLTGAAVWLFADMFTAKIGIHIGASGLIYAEAGFLFFSGIFRRNFLSLIISLMVAVLYGGLIFGIFPTYLSNISWESHLAGLLSGIILAWIYKNTHVNDYQ